MKNNYIKYRLILVSVIAIVMTLVVTGLNISCRDPKEFMPEFDSLMPPPPAPLLLHPCNDTVFRRPHPSQILFEWSYINGAHSYFFQHSSDSTFPESKTDMFELNCPSCTLGLVADSILVLKWYWRVRGYHRSWTWYTAWSEKWHYYVSK